MHSEPLQARAAYDKLTANDKVYVKNYDTLKKAEQELQKILQE